MNQRLLDHLNHLPASIWTTIAKIDEAKGLWRGTARLHPQTLKQLKRSVLITSTGASTRIEGSKMSDQDIEKMLKGLSIQTFSNRDTQEVKGYYELLDNIFNSHNTLLLNESTIKHFHSELLKYSDKDQLHRGQYKTNPNQVLMINAQGESVGVLFDTTPPHLTPSAMAELVAWVRMETTTPTLHPLITLGYFIVEFLLIHPFTDGNGRLSRLLTNLYLLNAGYAYMPYISLEKIIEDNKPEYYLSLRQTQTTLHSPRPDLVPWLLFFTRVLKTQSDLAIKLISDSQIDQILSQKQQLVLDYLVSHSPATPLDIAQATGVNRATVSQALAKLLKLHQVNKVGLGPATRYLISQS